MGDTVIPVASGHLALLYSYPTAGSRTNPPICPPPVETK